MTGGRSARRNRRAVIIGGSMSGLFSAAYLRQIDWDVDVYERSREQLVGRGAGIATHPELLEALESCGAGTRDLGVAVEKRITIDQAGRVIGERSLRQIFTSWDRLQHLLQQMFGPGMIISAAPSSASSRMAMACVFISRTAAARAQISWSAAMASAPACVLKSRRTCSPSMPATTSGVAPRTRSTSLPRRGKASFPITRSSCRSASKSSAIPSRA